MKKFASIVLAIMMVCTVLVMPVSAEVAYRVNETFDDMVYTTTVVREDGVEAGIDWAYPVVTSGSDMWHEYDGYNNSPGDNGTYKPYYIDSSKAAYAVNIDVVADDATHGKALQFYSMGSAPSVNVNHVYTYPTCVGFYGTTGNVSNNTSDFRVLETEVKFDSTTNDITGVIVELGGRNGLSMILYPKKIEILGKSIIPGAGLNVAATYDTTNILKALGYTNGLPKGEWHKVQLLIDAAHYSYDVFINDMLVMQNVSIANMAEYAAKSDASTNAVVADKLADNGNMMPAIGYRTAGYGTTNKFAIDNLKYYNVTDAEALEIAKAGVNKFFGDGVFSPDKVAARMTEYKTLELPYGGVTGFAYYASSTNKTIDNAVHTPYESYTWSKANEVGDTFTIADANYNWVAKDTSKAPYFFGYVADGGKEPYNSSWAPNPDKTNIDSYSQGAVTTITSSKDLGFDDGYLTPGAGANAYWDKEKKVDLSVNIVKGTASETVTKTLYFKRPLEPVLIDGIEVGQFVKGKTPNTAWYNAGKTQYEFSLKSTVGNTTDAAVALYGFVALIDEDENLVRAGVNGATTIEPGTVVDFPMYGSISNNDVDLTSVKGAKVFFFTADLKPYRAPFTFEVMPEGCENGLVKVDVPEA